MGSAAAAPEPCSEVSRRRSVLRVPDVPRTSRGSGTIQPVEGRLLDGDESQRVIEGQSGPVLGGGLDVDAIDQIGAGTAEDLAEEEAGVALAAMFGRDLEIDQAGAGVGVLAAEPSHLPGGGAGDHAAVGLVQEPRVGQGEFADGEVLPPV